MGKKGKKKGEKKAKVKRKGDVDARIKQAMSIEPPDENPHKLDNDNKIDKFLRFSFRANKKAKMSIKEQNRKWK